jgi:hypothetical protein
MGNANADRGVCIVPELKTKKEIEGNVGHHLEYS